MSDQVRTKARFFGQQVAAPPNVASGFVSELTEPMKSVRQGARQAARNQERWVKKQLSERAEQLALTQVAAPTLLAVLVAGLMVVGWALSAA